MVEYFIENTELKAVICSKGCELISAVLKKDNTERIWQANPESWKRHAPVLFPLVGKCRDNQVEHEGKIYEMSQHGFARDMEFTLVEQTADSITMKLEQTEETLKRYPFAFELLCRYVLKGSSIVVSWKVVNTNRETMYFSIGAHPAFICPGKESLAGCEVCFETEKSALAYELLNEKGLVEAQQYALKLQDSCVTVSPDFFDNDAYVFENYQCSKVSLLDNGKPFVSVSFDAPVFGLWSPAYKNVPFICIEPWYGRADKDSFTGSLKEREWGNALEAGQVFERSYEIVFA